MVTPNQAEYFKGLWRAQEARPRPPVVVGRPVAQPGLSRDRVRHRSGHRDRGQVGVRRRPGRCIPSAVSSPGNFPLAIAIGVLVVAYFGLAIQYFLLRFGRRGATYFALFLFLAWLVPLVAGTILAMASMTGGRRRRRARSCSA